MVEAIISEILANIVWIVLGAVVITVVTLGIRLFPAYKRQKRLFTFFGIMPNNAVLNIYLSTIFVIEQFPAATFSVKPDEIRIGGYKGPAIPSLELSIIDVLVNGLAGNPLKNFPTLIRNWLQKQIPELQPIRINVSPSPASRLPVQGFEFTSLISVGSETYNSVTDYYNHHYQGYLRLDPGNNYVIEVLRGSRKGEKIAPSNDTNVGGLAILERIVDDEHGTNVFLAAGGGTLGSVGATQYLIREWERLFEQYGNNPFAAILQFDAANSSHFSTLTPMKQDWFPPK